MNTQDIELLESLIDGELDPSLVGELKSRLERESDLAAVYQGLKEERELRKQTFEALAPTAEKADRFAMEVCSMARKSELKRWSQGGGMLRMIASVAACVLVGFGVGWLSRGVYHPGAQQVVQTPTVQAEPIVVVINDSSGNPISKISFLSSDQAKQFAEDLQNWQEQQSQLRGGYMYVRTASF